MISLTHPDRSEFGESGRREKTSHEPGSSDGFCGPAARSALVRRGGPAGSGVARRDGCTSGDITTFLYLSERRQALPNHDKMIGIISVFVAESVYHAHRPHGEPSAERGDPAHRTAPPPRGREFAHVPPRRHAP